jgi:hypothetical protein
LHILSLLSGVVHSRNRTSHPHTFMHSNSFCGPVTLEELAASQVALSDTSSVPPGASTFGRPFVS